MKKKVIIGCAVTAVVLGVVVIGIEKLFIDFAMASADVDTINGTNV